MKSIKLNKYIFGGFLLMAAAVVMTACEDDKPNNPTYDSTNIVSLSINVDGMEKMGTKTPKGDTITFKVSPNFDPTTLKGIKPTIYLDGAGATISPSPSTPQDFNKPVTYTVTAGNGVQRKWIVKWAYGRVLADGEGGGSAYTEWSKTAAEIGMTTSVENSAAVCGDYLVISRTHIVLNKFTGEKVDKKLNVTGIPGVIFFFTNDAKNRLVGTTLPALSNQKFNVYTWETLESEPQLLYSLDCTGNSQAPGRKVDLIGDIEKGAILTSCLGGNPAGGKFQRWQITNRTVTLLDQLDVPMPTMNGTPGSIQWQTLSMSKPEANARFYVTQPTILWGSIWSGIRLSYGTQSGGVSSFVKGNFVADDGSAGGSYWGNIIAGHAKGFNFNGAQYAAGVGAAWGGWSYCVMPESDITPQVVGKTIAIWEGKTAFVNGNQTSAIAVSDEGDYMLMYIFIENVGVTCGRITRYER